MEGLGAIEQIEGSGLDLDQIAGSDELLSGLGAVARTNPARARKTLQKATAATKRKSFSQGKTSGQLVSLTESTTSRAYFEMMKGQLPPEIQKKLEEKSYKAVDNVLYAVKDIENKQVINLFTSSDDKQAGKSNVNGAKLDAGVYFLATELIIDFGEFTNEPSDSDFSMDYSAAIKNGEFEFQVGDKKLVPDQLSMEAFNQEGITSVRSHVLKLSSPQWIFPQSEMKPKLYLTVAGGAKQCVKFIVKGTQVSNK